MTARPQTTTLRPEVTSTDHVQGRADAPVTLVEYGDFECPFCYRAHPIILDLQKQLGDKLRFVFRNFPLGEIHPHALHAAAAAECVGAHTGAGAYWTMYDELFDHQQDSSDALDDKHLVSYAAAAGTDPVQVERDLANDTYAERVHADFMSGVRSGVNGTPTFFVNGVRFDGDWTNPAEFSATLERAARATT